MEGSQQLFPDDSSEDYLQDPELWVDRLPQPFRMIDGLLQELLSRTWEAIETRELQRETERTRVRIPKAIAERAVEGVRGVRTIEAGRDVVFAGCLDRLSVLSAKGGETTYLSTSGAVTRLAVEYMDDIHVIAACIESGSAILLAYIQPPSGARLIQLADVPNQEEHRQTSAVHMAPSCTHIALITHSDSKDYQVVCYQLPKSSWRQELKSLLEEETTTTEMAFSKPTLLFTTCPPKPFAPCTAISQHAALLNVFGGGEVIATGENHTLTTTYLENRRRMFESRRAGFMQESAPTTPTNRIPTCHFLYFKDGTKQEVPCSLSVWWSKETQIFLYSLSAKGSSPVLERVITQGSTVCVTAVSCCARYLAVGLQSGVIVMWDLKTNFCRSVEQVVPPPDIPAALMFYTSSATVPPTLAVGTNRGTVLLVKPDLTVVSLNQRVSKQQEVYPSLFDSTGYNCCKIVTFASCPLSSLVVSVHEDGSVILWSIVDLEPLCTVAPPSSHTALPSICALTTKCVFLAVQSHDMNSRPESTTDSCIRCLHLPSVTYLQKYLTDSSVDSLEGYNDRDTPANLMDEIQNRLIEINTKIFKDNDLFQAERRSKWEEFAQHLQAPS